MTSAATVQAISHPGQRIKAQMHTALLCGSLQTVHRYSITVNMCVAHQLTQLGVRAGRKTVSKKSAGHFQLVKLLRQHVRVRSN